MPCLSGRFDPSIGPLINIGIIPAGLFTPSYSGQITTFPALIDTGASVTCISQNVVEAAGLQPIGMRPMVSATHSVPVNVYLVDLFLPFGAAGFIIQGAQIMEFIPEGSAPFQRLLGFDGHFTFSL